MLIVIGLILGILIPALWIFLPLKKVEEDKRLGTKSYIKSILIGMTICSICIIIAELTFTKITGYSAANPCRTISQAFIMSFLYAALLEETIKFIFVKRVIRRFKPQDKLQYMLIAGTIGMGYGITEKVALGPSLMMIFSAVFALHILFQFIMGAYLFEAEKARLRGDEKYKSYTIKAFLVPFVIHGFWDLVLMSNDIYADPASIGGIISIAVLFIAIIAAIVFEILTIRHLRRMDVEQI